MPIQCIEQVSVLRRLVADWRRAGGRVALVPTMGNLHEGHLTLVREARALADRVLVSVFVNPLQFGPDEDYAAYPRTLEQDCRMLDAAGTDVLFTPTLHEVYPRGQEGQTRVEVPGVSDILCGASRPGHFVGVATIVCKLFNMSQPHIAVFGEKDFQQLMVIRLMVEDLCMPVDIRGVAMVREADGLAMSSRNRYLEPGERARAPTLFESLQGASERLRSSIPVAEVEQLAIEELVVAGFRPDYLSVRRVRDLQVPEDSDRELVVLVAAHLGRARLIDNLRVTR